MLTEIDAIIDVNVEIRDLRTMQLELETAIQDYYDLRRKQISKLFTRIAPAIEASLQSEFPGQHFSVTPNVSLQCIDAHCTHNGTIEFSEIERRFRSRIERLLADDFCSGDVTELAKVVTISPIGQLPKQMHDGGTIRIIFNFETRSAQRSDRK